MLSPRWLNEARAAVGARGQDDRLARSRLRRTLRHRRPGRTDARGGGRGQRRAASASRPSRGRTTAIQLTDTSSFAAGQPFAEGRRRLSASSTTATPRCRCTSAAATCSRRCRPSGWAAARRHHGHPGARAGAARRLHPGLRQSGGRVSARGTSRSSCRTSGAIARKLMLKPGLRYQRQYWPDCHLRRVRRRRRRLCYGFPRDGNNFAPRLAVAYDLKGDGRTSIHAAYGSFFDNQIVSIVRITGQISTAARRRAHARRSVFPRPVAAWRAPGHRLPEPPSRSVPEPR